MSAKLTIKKEALLHNMRALKELAKKHGASLSVVTKGLVGYEPLVKLLVENGAGSICEAHIENLEKWDALPAEKWMIRSPLLSETDEVVRYADVSLASEQSVLERLSSSALALGKTHKTVIMLELGELREGCMPEDALPLCELCLSLPGLQLHGIGAHLSSMYEIVPDAGNMSVLIKTAEEIEKKLGMTLPVISGGSSSAIKMIEEGTFPSRINHLRMGEAVLLGTIAGYDTPFKGARTDAFSFCAEIVELKEKPSAPWGKLADGSDPPYLYHAEPGFRKLALVSIGKQDVFSKYLFAKDSAITILGDTCDVLIADVTDSDIEYRVGDNLEFGIKYHGIMSAMASDYVEKDIV